MGRLSVSQLRYMSKDEFRLLTAVEMGMKNHELVPGSLIVSIAALQGGGAHKTLKKLTQEKLLAYEKGKRYDGYRLTNLGYDFLALKALSKSDAVSAVGNQIGVGKESDVYLARDANDQEVVLKLHKLGRTSFRRLKQQRDYHQHRASTSWLYLSRLAAAKEFAFMSALHERGLPVPTPLALNRHCVVMSRVDGVPLASVADAAEPERLHGALMQLIVRLGALGLIHGDFNEFNLIVDEQTQSPVLIDFPQMVSVSHTNAQWYFERDVQCVRDFFRRRFGLDHLPYPTFDCIEHEESVDVQVSASGFNLVDDGQPVEEASSESAIGVDAWLSDSTAVLEQLKLEQVEQPTAVSECDEDASASGESGESDGATSAATVSAADVRQRLRREAAGGQRHRRMRLEQRKAKAASTNRDRRANRVVIGEYQGWDF